MKLSERKIRKVAYHEAGYVVLRPALRLSCHAPLSLSLLKSALIKRVSSIKSTH
jgi:hypothetical protein